MLIRQSSYCNTSERVPSLVRRTASDVSHPGVHIIVNLRWQFWHACCMWTVISLYHNQYTKKQVLMGCSAAVQKLLPWFEPMWVGILLQAQALYRYQLAYHAAISKQLHLFSDCELNIRFTNSYCTQWWTYFAFSGLHVLLYVLVSYKHYSKKVSWTN